MGRSSLRITHVLCPIDFSSSSRHALRYGAAVAKRFNTRMTVLFVNDPLLGSAAAAAAYDTRALAARTRTELGAFTRRALGLAAESVEYATAIGHPAPEIAKAVTRLGADLVVMASRGLSGPAKWFLGSTTEHVLRATKIPLLIIPNAAARPHARWAKAMRSWPGRHAIVPIDLGREAQTQVRAAMAVARAFEVAPLLLHVVAPPRWPAWMGVDSGAVNRARYEEAQTRLELLARRLGPGTASRVASGDPAEQIIASAADLKSGLVILTLKRAGTRGPRRGAITYRLLCSGTVPVLALAPSAER